MADRETFAVIKTGLVKFTLIIETVNFTRGYEYKYYFFSHSNQGMPSFYQWTLLREPQAKNSQLRS